MTNVHQKKHYKVKGLTNFETYVWVLAEETTGYRILLRSYSQDSVKESEEFISFHLFDACVRTGYLSEIREQVSA